MSNNYQPIQNENYKIIFFNIRHSSHLNIWEASLSSDSGSQVLFIPEHTHALAHQNKDEKGSYRFSKVCSGQAQNDRERWLVRFVGSCATGPVGSPLHGKYWCARANRLTLATVPRASLHVNPFVQIARTNHPIVAFCNFIHTFAKPYLICVPSRNIFPKILPRLSNLSRYAIHSYWTSI